MEFFLGSIFTFFLLTVVRAMFIRSNLDKKYSIRPISYTQSHIHSLISQSIAQQLMPPEPLETQARALLAKNSLRVVFADNTAYWIKDNQFFQANVINGQIDNSTTKVVDTMGMSKVELDKMFFIVQKLTEGKKNDDRDSGFKGL
jgi:hypothetical protein